jgi:4-oxalmesaconate hydratase
MLDKPSLAEHLMKNVYFDTCIYHQPGIDLLFNVIERKNILFGSEMLGAVRGVDPETGNYFDDTKRFIDALALSDEQRAEVFEGNARRVYPRLDAALKARV